MVRVLKQIKEKKLEIFSHPGLARTLAARFACHVLLNNFSVLSLLLYFTASQL